MRKLAMHLSPGPGGIAGALRRLVVELLLMVGGALACAFAVNVFYVPIRLTMGGVSGLVSILFQLTGKGGFLPFGVLVILFNIPLLVLGMLHLGRRFVVKTLVGTLVYSVAIDATAKSFTRLYDEFINRPLDVGLPDPLIYCIFGGIVYGLGLGMIFRAGFTTGGTDIAAKVIKRHYRTLSLGQFILLLDIVVLICAALAYAREPGPSVLLAMYSAIALFLTAKVTDLVIEGFDYKRAAIVISDRSAEIAARVMTELDRGMTGLHGQGMYTGKEKEVLLCVLPQNQVLSLRRLVQETDPDAFMIVVDSREVLGEGFEGDDDDRPLVQPPRTDVSTKS
jgi:uncharacterized membrane-anchored protein YitT (DUF2179 family)